MPSPQKVVAVAYKRLQIKGFDWEKFGVLDRWLLMGGDLTWRFDCISDYKIARVKQAL